MDFCGGFASVRMRVAWDSTHIVMAGRWTMGPYIVFAKKCKKSQLHVLVIYDVPSPTAILPSSDYMIPILRWHRQLRMHCIDTGPIFVFAFVFNRVSCCTIDTKICMEYLC